MGRGQRGGGGGNEQGKMGKGQQGGGDGEGPKGREGKDGGKHIECLGGIRLQFFVTLFTRATLGTPASICYKVNKIGMVK